MKSEYRNAGDKLTSGTLVAFGTGAIDKSNLFSGACPKGDFFMEKIQKKMKKNGEKIILDLCGGTGAWSEPYKKAGYDVRVITLPEYDVRSFLLFDERVWFTKNPYEYKEVCLIKNVYGILAAPPCTMFSFARTNAKTQRDLKGGMECVRACLNVIWKINEIKQATSKKTLPLKFWALENPYYGFLPQFLGKPAFTFDPWEFGDGYQKRTALWGYFNKPIKNPIPIMTKEAKAKAKTNSFIHKLSLMPSATIRDDAPLRYKIAHEKARIKFDYLKSKDIHPEAFGRFDRQTRRSITPAGFAKAFFKANL